MIFSKLTGRNWTGNVAVVACALALAACAGGDLDVDDTTGSHLAQPPPGSPPDPTVQAGDIAIAAQEFSHSIRGLPQIANETTPPLVKFTGVTSILRDQNGQLASVDTEPYTALLRDRLLLGDREQLRFVEHELPPLVTHSKHGKSDSSESDSAEYKVLAELRGRADADYYRVQMEFVEISSGNVLFSAVYRISKEAPESSASPTPEEDADQQPIPEAPQTSPPVNRQSDVPAASGQYQPPIPPGNGDDGN